MTELSEGRVTNQNSLQSANVHHRFHEPARFRTWTFYVLFKSNTLKDEKSWILVLINAAVLLSFET